MDGNDAEAISVAKSTRQKEEQLVGFEADHPWLRLVLFRLPPSIGLARIRKKIGYKSQDVIPPPC